MKILKLKLENFIGIYNGMGKYKFELDLTKVKSKNNIILLQGKNGSGKSTVLSCLHPFSGTMDERTEIILPNTDGYKEIHIKNKKDLYKICHHYFNKRKTKSIKSYISKYDKINKQWIELNPNGTVGSFEKIVEQELDVVPAFFVLSRIGSNVKNFIGLKPSERKNYMSKFLPDISEYLENYKKVNEKFIFLNKRIKSLIVEIDKIEKEEVLLADKERLSNVVIKLNRRIDKILEEKNKNNGILSTFESDLVVKFNNCESNFNRASNAKNKLIENFDLYNLDISIDDKKLLDDYRKKLKEIISSIATKKEKIINSKETKKQLRENASNLQLELDKDDAELEKYNIGNLNELLELKEEYENSIKILDKKIDNFDENYKLNLTDEEINNIIEFITYIQSNSLFSNYDLNIANYCLDNFKTLSIEKLEKEINDLREEKSNYENNSKELNKNIILLQSKLNLKEVLKQRPKECKINNCSFISEALKYEDADKEINDLQTKLKKIESKIKELSENEKFKLNCYNYLNNFFKLFKEIKAFIFFKHLNKLLPGYFNSEEEFTSFIFCDKNYFKDEFEKALEYAHLLADRKSNNEILEKINSDITNINNKNEILEKINSNIKKNSNLLSKNNKKLKEINILITQLNEDIEKLETEKEDFEEIIKIKETYDKACLIIEQNKTKMEKYNEDVKRIKELESRNNDLDKEYEEKDKELKAEQEKLDRVNYKITRLHDFQNELEEVRSTFENVENIRKALSPSKGIPLLFVDVYLKKTRDIANDLLDIAFNGQFYIEDFELTESDFFIKIVKEGGVPLKDVTLASQGEVSLINTAISLAMIQQSTTKYNILLFDEIDKELDEANRRSFVDILEKQLEMLNIEQAFIISHNKEFDNSNLDLILFNEHGVDTESKEYMNGKNILYP